MNYVLGIDIGTTHCKTVAMGADGSVLHEARAHHPTVQEHPGQSEQDAETVFGTMLQVVQQSLAALAGHQLQAACFSAAMHSLLAVDSRGAPLTPAYTWADTRSNAIARSLRASSGAMDLYNNTGTPIHPMSPLCKIAWMKQEMPQVFDAAAKFISIKEYIVWRLFGQYVIDHSIASATGLFDIRARQWYGPALGIAGISAERLSSPVPVTWRAKELKEEYGRLLGIDTRIPFIIGASDGCLANAGCGALGHGEVALTIGTSGAVRLVVDEPRADAGGRLFNYILSDGLYVTGGPVSNGGAALQWFGEHVLQQESSGPGDLDWLLQLAAQSPAGAEGLVFLPYLSGERAPFWDAAARGAFIGLQLSHRKEHLARAVLEGISFGLRQVMEAVEESNGPVLEVYANGAFVRSPSWLQLMADVLNKNIVVSGMADASAVGAAFMAWHAVGLLRDLKQAKQFIPQGERYVPDQNMHGIYNRNFDIYRGLYPKLAEDFVRLG